MHDLILEGGTVVDGTGASPREADVAIDGARITAVGKGLGPARRSSTRAASSSRRASSTSTRTTTARPPGTRC